MVDNICVYLSGAMQGCTNEEMLEWRNKIKEGASRCEFLDPTRHDYRGAEHSTDPALAFTIVQNDIKDIAQCGIIVVKADRPSWGTAMEVKYARDMGKIVVSICPGPASPWLRYHSNVIVSSIDEAIEWLNAFCDSIIEEQRVCG